MFEYQESIDIQRPAADVFAYLIEAENIPEWVDTTLEAWQVSEGPAGEGTIQAETVTLGFFSKSLPSNELHWKITEFEENRQITYEIDTEIGYQRQSFSFEQIEQGTRLVVNGLHRFRGPLRFAQPVARFFIVRARRTHLLNLKQLLETGRRES